MVRVSKQVAGDQPSNRDQAMSENVYDLVVIGSGPGGYVAAIRAAQLGLKTACVEGYERLGGTCLNVGCIPSKALLHSSHLYEETAHGLAEHGITTGKTGFDLATMMGRKEQVVGGLTDGIAFLFKKNKIDRVTGWGRIKESGLVQVTGADGKTQDLVAENILIATGSKPMPLPGVEIDEARIVSSTGALSLPKVPKHLVVVGAGVIGLELGTVWRRLGAEVTVIEFLDRALPEMDAETAKTVVRSLKKQGMTFKLGRKVTKAKATKSNVTLTFEPAKGGDADTIKADVVLVAIGRRPYTEGLGLEKVGIATDARGFIPVDDRFKTAVDGIYAIGDVIGGAMLAHKAEEEGVACVEGLAGQHVHVNYDAIPGVVYTAPEVAAVGRTEEQLKEAGIDYRVGKFPFSANSRARTSGEMEGWVKILADAENDKVLGAHIIGPQAGDLIHEAVLAIEFGASAEDLARTCHAHPTVSEAVKEAALAVAKRPINM